MDVLFLYRNMSAMRRLKQSQFFLTLYLHVHFEWGHFFKLWLCSVYMYIKIQCKTCLCIHLYISLQEHYVL